MTSATATHQLTRNGSRAISVRVTDLHWRHLVVQASFRETNIATVIRDAIEAHLASQPDLGHEDGSPGTSMTYRAFLGIADLEGAAAELQAREQDASS